MRDELIKRNLIITIVSLIMFFLLSLYITSYSSRKSLEKNLINVTNVITEQILNENTLEDIEKVFALYDNNNNWLQIEMANNKGIIVYNSMVDEMIVSENNCFSDKELTLANQETVNEKRIYVNENNIYYINKVNDDIIIRTSFPLESNTTYILNSILYLLILIIVVLILNIIFTHKTSQIIVNSFKSISSHLKTINEGEYKKIDVNHSFEEVRESLEEINVINENITKSIQIIKNERDKLNFIIDNMQQGIMIINEAHQVLIMNDFASDVLQIDIKEIINKPYNEFINIEILDQKTKQVFDKNITTSFDYSLTSLNKIYSFFISSLKTKWNAEEDPINLAIILISDVTEERHNDEIKAEFIANASHELKTPITVIKGFSELIINGLCENEEQIIKYNQKIYDEAIRMKETIDELLYLANLEYQSNKVKFQDDVYLKEVITEVIEKYQQLALEHQVTITLSCQDVYIKGSRSLIKHLMNNIIENAIKYNKINGFVYINIYDKDQFIYYETIDTGQGIEAKSIDRIFERFYRVEESHNRQTGGTGLGLTIVKKICLLHGAELIVNSEVNIGTNLTVKFVKE